MSADPSAGSANLLSPQSLNLYSYVANDPVNGVDPQGLCTVIIGGITQTANSKNTETQEELANVIGAISALPYAGGGQISGAANILAQGIGIPTGATATAVSAINLAAQTPGPIDIIAFSGGAAAFSRARNYLNAVTRSRIQSLTSIDPAAIQLQRGNGASVSVYSDSVRLANTLLSAYATLRTLDVNKKHETGTCGHDANCAIRTFFDSLVANASFCLVGAGSVFGVPTKMSASFIYSPPAFFSFIYEKLLASRVTFTIGFDPF